MERSPTPSEYALAITKQMKKMTILRVGLKDR
jgi:hypothetical protein